MSRGWSGAALGLLLTLGVGAGLWVLRPGMAFRDPPPDTSFQAIDGRKLSLAALRGHPVLVNFWSTSCRPCIEEMPLLARLYRRWSAQGLELIGVAAPYDRPDNVVTLARREAIPYPVALDLTGAVEQAFGGIRGTPTSFLIGPAGHVRLRTQGPLDGPGTEREIAAMLHGG